MGQAEDDVSDVAVNDGIDQVLKDKGKLLPVPIVSLQVKTLFFSLYLIISIVMFIPLKRTCTFTDTLGNIWMI